jgi:hypothetical protein
MFEKNYMEKGIIALVKAWEAISLDAALKIEGSRLRRKKRRTG